MLTFGTLDVGSVYNDRQYERELNMFLLIQFSSAQGSRLFNHVKFIFVAFKVKFLLAAVKCSNLRVVLVL